MEARFAEPRQRGGYYSNIGKSEFEFVLPPGCDEEDLKSLDEYLKNTNNKREVKAIIPLGMTITVVL